MWVDLRKRTLRAFYPDPPSNITTVQVAPSITRLEWDAPQNVSGNSGAYTVVVCDQYSSCDRQQNLKSCLTRQTKETWLVLNNSPVTKHCVLVTASAHCGARVLKSLPTIAEIATPIYVPHAPDVTNLKLAAVGKDFFKVTWDRPTEGFDAYWAEIIDVTGGNINKGLNRYGTCTRSMEIQPHQTHLNCSGLEPCSKLSVRIGTLTKPPLLTRSSGVTLTEMLISERVAPVVRNLTLSSVGVDNFTLTWLKPKGCFDYYTVKVTEDNEGSNCSRCPTIVSCNGGDVIDASQTSVTCDQPETCTNVTISVQPRVWGVPVSPLIGDTLAGIYLQGKDQTQVTCSQLQPCSKVNFKVRTHIDGPPARTSSGVSLYDILIPASVRPEVTNLQLGAVDADTFALKWEQPEACFDYYTVEVTDESTYKRSVVTCNNGLVIKPNQTSVTCEQMKTCANVTIRVKTHTRGPPELSSTGAVLGHVFLLGKAPTEPTDLRELIIDSGSMKIALLLWIVGCHSGPLLVYTAEGAKLTAQPDQSTAAPAKLDYSHRVTEGSSHASDGLSPESAGALNRVSRAAHAFDDVSGSVDEYGVLRAVLNAPRQHGFLHFGRKRAVSAAYLGSPALNSDSTASVGEEAEGSGRENKDDDEVTASKEGPQAAALRWAKRTLRDDPNSFLHFGKREPEEERNGGVQVRIKRNVQDARSLEAAEMPNTEGFEPLNQQAEPPDSDILVLASKTKRSPNYVMHFGKRLESASTVGESDDAKRPSHNSIMHFGKRNNEQDVAAALENIYSTINGGSVKRGANRVMHFGKRDPEYGVSTTLEVAVVEKLTVRLTKLKRKNEGGRIMYSGKREDEDSSGMTLSSTDDASSTTVKRFASASSKSSGRLDQLQSFSGIGREHHRVFQEWKKRNRVLHFSKREPQPLSGHYYQQKRQGDRIIHFGEEAGYPFYANVAASAAATMKDKKLKHSILHFGKRDDKIVIGADKRHRSMRFGKQIGNDYQKYQYGQRLPMEKRLGNRILLLAKMLQAPHLQSLNAWDYGIDTAAKTSRAGASKRARRILHFDKRDGLANYDDIGTGFDPLVLAQDFDEANTSQVSGGHGQRETQKVIRKKRSTTPAESSDCIDDTVAQMMGSMEQITMDIVNVTVRLLTDTSITASWLRPQYSFDYYKLDITQDKLNSEGHPYRRIVGSCGIDKYAGNTTLTHCGDFDGCTHVNLEIWAYNEGPPERALLVNGIGRIFLPGHVVPEVQNLALIDVGPDYFTVFWTKPAVSFDYYWVEVQYIRDESDMLTPHRVGSCANGTVVHRTQTQITCDKFKACANEAASTTILSRWLKKIKDAVVSEASVRVPASGGIIVDANQSSVTCGKTEASSVPVTVRTHRRGPLQLTSSGVTVHDIIMSEKDMPEVLPILHIGRDSFVLRWHRPSGCFDKYVLEVTYHGGSEPYLKRLGDGFCAGTTILDPDPTSVTCAIIPACANTSMVLRTQRNGPHVRTSRGEALHKYFDSAGT
ncbi:hypothetical protein MTO96_014024 [Rhipicephalus appendiculatus]